MASPLDLLKNEEITGKKLENVYGLEKSDLQKLHDTQQEYVKSLEDRYAQPNLWSVAAGFAKPQLGGFLASIGSASQALGEQAEKQRDIQLPLYKAKSELEIYKAMMKQKGKAAAKAEQIVGENRTPTPTEQMDITSLTEGPTKGAEAGALAQRSQAEQMMSALSSARDWATLVKDLGGKFSEEQVGDFLRKNPSIIPPAGTPEQYKPKPIGAGGVGGAGNEPAQAIPGVPSELSGGATHGQQLAATSEQIKQRVDRVNDLTKNLGSQATLSAPIYESATSLYQLASKPSLKPAFAVFEGGDPMSILGKAMEDQTVSNVLANARSQLIHARYGSEDEKKQALSDFHSFENALGQLNNAVINGFANPTDARTMIEKASVPNARNTRDAFLRGLARIGSDALARYETKNALDDYLKTKNADIMKWESSPQYTKTIENLGKRNTDLISNTASEQLPAFMRSGLHGSYRYKGDKSDLKEIVKRRIEEENAKKKP